MTTSAMLRPFLRSSGSSTLKSTLRKTSSTPTSTLARTFATQSSDDTKKPTALAKLHLEDGTTITGTSFGSHEAVEGEVRNIREKLKKIETNK